MNGFFTDRNTIAGRFFYCPVFFVCKILEVYEVRLPYPGTALSDFEYSKIGKEIATDGRKRKILYRTERTNL